jgi:hypothetical protein
MRVYDLFGGWPGFCSAGSTLDDLMRGRSEKRATIGRRLAKKIKVAYNNCVTNDPCWICGVRTDPIGFDFMVDCALVCDECVKEFAPRLYTAWPYQKRHRALRKVWNDLSKDEALQTDSASKVSKSANPKF